jgi:hypothetical protein
MTVSIEFYSVIRKVFRVLPTFFFSALFGCVIALLLGISPGQLAVAVTAPLVFFFGFNRVLVVVLPKGEYSTHPISKTFSFKLSFLFAAGIFFSISFVVVFGLSTLVYLGLGLTEMAESTLLWVGRVALLSGIMLLLFFTLNLSRNVLDDIARRMVTFVWELLYMPTRIAERLLSPFERHWSKTHFPS